VGSGQPDGVFQDRIRAEVRGETVWKIGISPEMGVLKALKRAKEAAIGRFLPPRKRTREALGYFPNSFSTHSGE
jgi:hypothetical protein